jgi:hypothetical protein
MAANVEQCFWGNGRRSADIRVTENPGEVVKHVTKPARISNWSGTGAMARAREARGASLLCARRLIA